MLSISMDSGLTFDWDGVSIEEDLVNIELMELFDHFGEGLVSSFFIRKGTSCDDCGYVL